jgi:hypothetical protein
LKCETSVGSTVPVAGEGEGAGAGLCRAQGVVAKHRDAIAGAAGGAAALLGTICLDRCETHCCTARAALAGLYGFIVQQGGTGCSFDGVDVTKLLALGPSSTHVSLHNHPISGTSTSRHAIHERVGVWIHGFILVSMQASKGRF